MRKLLFTLIALLAFSSCQKEETKVVEEPQRRRFTKEQISSNLEMGMNKSDVIQYLGKPDSSKSCGPYQSVTDDTSQEECRQLDYYGLVLEKNPDTDKVSSLGLRIIFAYDMLFDMSLMQR